MPDFVKGQVVQAVEGSARALGRERVTSAVLDEVIERWIATGDFNEGGAASDVVDTWKCRHFHP